MNVRTVPKLVAAAATGTLLLGSAAAVAATSASAAHTERIEVWVSPPKGNSAVQRIMLTGAIADYGKATSTTKAGKPDPNGNYVHIVLRKGTFRINAVTLNNKLGSMRPNVDKATCSIWLTGSGPVTLFDGTGRYAGISGRIKITVSFAAIFPRFTSGPKKGQCNHSNKVQPTASFAGQLTGVGNVSIPSS